jgi:hypothetical protein
MTAMVVRGKAIITCVIVTISLWLTTIHLKSQHLNLNILQIDFKIKAWERLRIPEELKQEVIDLVGLGEITCSQDLYDRYPDTDFVWEFICGSETQLSREENDGNATIEFIHEIEMILCEQ